MRRSAVRADRHAAYRARPTSYRRSPAKASKRRKCRREVDPTLEGLTTQSCTSFRRSSSRNPGVAGGFRLENCRNDVRRLRVQTFESLGGDNRTPLATQLAPADRLR